MTVGEYNDRPDDDYFSAKTQLRRRLEQEEKLQAEADEFERQERRQRLIWYAGAVMWGGVAVFALGLIWLIARRVL
jgi:hypothetical protein